jgi:hypothetical protein
MLVTSGKERGAFARRQLVRRTITPAAFEKGERTIVKNEVLVEELIRYPKARGEQAPESIAANLIAITLKARYPSLRVLVRRNTNRPVNPKPVSDCLHLSERHSRLYHSKWSGIHA